MEPFLRYFAPFARKWGDPVFSTTFVYNAYWRSFFSDGKCCNPTTSLLSRLSRIQTCSEWRFCQQMTFCLTFVKKHSSQSKVFHWKVSGTLSHWKSVWPCLSIYFAWIRSVAFDLHLSYTPPPLVPHKVQFQSNSQTIRLIRLSLTEKNQ